MGIIKKIRKVDQSMGRRILRAIGIQGSIKSIYYSLKYTGESGKILINKNASIRIHSDAEMSVENVVSFGVYYSDIIDYTTGGPRIYIGPEARFEAGSGIPHIGPGTNMSISGDFSIGNSYINGDSRIYCKNEIKIGDDCSISWRVDVLDSNGGHKILINNSNISREGPVHIGNHVWIGHGTSILPDVEIGDGAVIAAKSLVNKDIPENSLAAGIPAEIIESNITWN